MRAVTIRVALDRLLNPARLWFCCNDHVGPPRALIMVLRIRSVGRVRARVHVRELQGLQETKEQPYIKKKKRWGGLGWVWDGGSYPCNKSIHLHISIPIF